MSAPVLVVGSVAYDDVATPQDSRKEQLVGVVGRDFKDSDRQMLVDHGVDVDGLITDNDGDSFRWGGRYHDDMNQRTTLYTHLNVFERFNPVLPPAYRAADFLFLGNIHPALQANVLDQVEGAKFVTLDTMNFWIDGELDALHKVLGRVDGLVINDEEGALLTGARTALTIGRGLQALGPKTVVLKRGEHGALLFHNQDIFFVPGFPLEDVVDPTGAGDTFAGGFMGYLAHAEELTLDNLRRAMLTGSIMASFCVEGFGLERLATVTIDDIRARYHSFESLTRCPSLTL
ncbi:MAG: sugar/nucleoside kinase (ribokinase family) [Myxococcota bacterium]|jgi:sugar/nucleoside kinase (ribokinase family)